MKLSEIKSFVAEGAVKQAYQNLLDAVAKEYKLDDDDTIEAIAQYLLGDEGKNDDAYEFLYHFYSANGEMPYEAQKARGMDPQNWVSDHTSDIFAKYTKGL